jgi:putative transposase
MPLRRADRRRMPQGPSALAWCLMPNHVHLMLVPGTLNGLVDALSTTHQRYTWLVNRRNGWQGHLWQSRFYSCPLDDEHLVSAIRYVELNPLRARLVSAPEQWRWSSVRGRVSGKGDALVHSERPLPLRDVGDWLAFLGDDLADEETKRIRSHQRAGRVLGDAAFVARIEATIGRSLNLRPRGRPRRRENGDSHPFAATCEPRHLRS